MTRASLRSLARNPGNPPWKQDYLERYSTQPRQRLHTLRNRAQEAPRTRLPAWLPGEFPVQAPGRGSHRGRPGARCAEIHSNGNVGRDLGGVMIQAIETCYDGYRFRSRLEARWAVFFNALGIAWEYEKEGFDIPRAGWYLPDFWLPAQDLWVEVKGAVSTHAELEKLVYASRYLPGAATGVFSVPYDRYRVDVTGPGLIVLGQVPLVREGWMVWHTGYRFQEPSSEYCLPQHYWTAAWTFHHGRLNMHIDNMCDLGTEGALQLNLNSPSVSKFDAYVLDDDWREFGADRGAVRAYAAARSARFEHGQSGASG